MKVRTPNSAPRALSLCHPRGKRRIPDLFLSIAAKDKQADGLGALLRLSGFLGLRATVGTLLLRLVVRMRFLVVVAASATEKEQNFLRIAAAHAPSFRGWWVAVKRTMVPNGG